MQKAGRKSTRYGTIRTGRRSPPSKTAASGSSVSSRGSISSTSTRRKSSNSTIRAPRSRSLNNPFQVSLNLVMKIQEMDNKKFTMEPLALSLNNVNYLQNVQQRQQQRQSSTTKSSRRDRMPQSEHRPSSIRSVPPHESGNDSVFLYDTPSATKKVDPLKNSETEASVKSQENRFEELQKIAEQSALSSKKKKNLKLFNSQTSQTSSAGKKKEIQSAEKRYKNKQSLLRFASLAKSRSKSTGASLKFDELYPRPRKLSFSDCEDSENSIASADKAQVVGNGTKKFETDITFPLDKSIRNLSGLGGLEIAKSPNQSLTKSPAQIVAENRTPTTEEIRGMMSPILEDTVSADAKSDGRSSLKSNTSMSFGSNNPVNVVVANGTITTETPPITAAATPILINTFSDDKNGRRDSVASETSMCFDQCNGLDVPCDIEVNRSDNATKMYDHLREMRIGFIANGVHMALNFKLNVRSDEEILYLEPVELLYEGNKMWRRSARQVSKEIEVQRMADKKKMDMLNLSGAQKKQMIEQTSPSMKSILKNGNPAAVVDAGKAGPSSSKANGKKI